jgi:hypothetical protein
MGHRDDLQPVCGACHDFCREFHQSLHRSWQIGGAGRNRVFSVFGFLFVHLLEYGEAALVILREALEVTLQVFADLAFRLRNEAEAPAVTENAARCADRKCARVPDRAQPARRFAEFRKTL